jgi:hypothetical protein
MPVEPSNLNAKNAAATHKKKQILVVVLLVGLLIAMVTQPEPSTEFDDESALPTTSVVTAIAPSTLPHAKLAKTKHSEWLCQTHELSRLELDQIMATRLFVVEPATIQERLVNQITPSEPVMAIYGSPDNQAALVGQTIVRSGQVLPAGGTVVNVNVDGIEITP